MGQFVHYLPQIVKEHYIYNEGAQDPAEDGFPWSDDGKPIFDYSGMPEPYLSLAFRDHPTTPITHVEDTKMGERYQRPVFYAEFVGPLESRAGEAREESDG